MSTYDDDFFGDAIEDTSTNDNTSEVIKAFNELREAESNAEVLAAQLEGENKAIRELKTKTLPDLLKEMGTELWKDPETGIIVELETAVNASLPKDIEKRNEMLEALRPVGIEQIMAEEFIVNFMPNDKRSHAIRAILGLDPQTSVLEDDEEDHRLTNSQLDLVHTVREELELGALPAGEKLGCHPATLKKFLRELLAKGDAEITQAIDDAGIWHGKHAKIKKPKGVK